MQIETIFRVVLLTGSLLAAPAVLRSNGTSRRGIGLLALVGFWFVFWAVSLRGAVDYPPRLLDGLFLAGGVSLVVGLWLLATE
jgi:hypothetical protein